MNKNRLMAAGSLLAIGAMFPIVTAALTGAAVPPVPSPTATATASPSATAEPATTASLSTTATASPSALPVGKGQPLESPAPEPTVSNPEPTFSDVAVGPGTVPAPSQKAPTPCMEDETCWDCRVMGNMICGVEPARLEDAWTSFDAEKVADVVGKSISFSSTYIGTSGAASIPGYWVVPSLQHPNTFHVFLIQPGE